jgi:hypothetical protein
MTEWIGWLCLLAVLGFVQNASFTWTSRSRNSGDPHYHRYAAWCSNGIWVLCFTTLMKQIWENINTNNWLGVGIIILVYTVATAEGSVMMMKLCLKWEQGKQQVGARQ